MPDETQEPGMGKSEQQTANLEMTQNPYESGENAKLEFVLEFAKNPIVQLTIWAELEAHRIAWQQLGNKPERIEKDNEANFPKLIEGLSVNDLEEDRRLKLWTIHHVRSTYARLFSGNKVNPNFIKIEPNENPESVFKKIFDIEWDRQWREKRPSMGEDLDSPQGEPLGDPCEQPRSPYWLMK